MGRTVSLLVAAATTLLLTIAVAPASSAPHAKVDRGGKLDALRQYHADPGEVTTDPVRVSFAEAAAAAEVPGAVTEGQVPFAGLQPAPLAKSGATVESSEGGGGGNACWWVERNNSQGLGPQWRSAVVQTYWCAVYGSHITYRTSNPFGRTNGMCSWNPPSTAFRISGGVGYRWVKIHSESWFGCWVWPGYTLYDSKWLRPEYNVWGNSNDGEKN